MCALYVGIGVSALCALLGVGWLGQKVLGHGDDLPGTAARERTPSSFLERKRRPPEGMRKERGTTKAR